ncbi:hypothetical protein D3C87_1837620 [compost metagenome]
MGNGDGGLDHALTHCEGKGHFVAVRQRNLGRLDSANQPVPQPLLDQHDKGLDFLGLPRLAHGGPQVAQGLGIIEPVDAMPGRKVIVGCDRQVPLAVQRP